LPQAEVARGKGGGKSGNGDSRGDGTGSRGGGSSCQPPPEEVSVMAQYAETRRAPEAVCVTVRAPFPQRLCKRAISNKLISIFQRAAAPP